MKPRILVVMTVSGFVLVSSTVAVFAQRGPRVAGEVPREFVIPAVPQILEIPEIPPIPPMPPIPPLPPMPAGLAEFRFFMRGQSESTDPAVRLQQEVFRTLLRNSPDRALELAADRLKADPGDPVVLANLSMIGSTNSPKALPLLVSIAKSSPNVNARREATMSIARTRGDKDALTILDDLYTNSSDNVEVRRTVVNSIARLSDPRAISVLSRIVKNDPDDNVRRSAVQALGGRKEPEAMKALEDLLKEAPKPKG